MDFSNYETALLSIFLSSLLFSTIAIAIFEKQIILSEFMLQHPAYASSPISHKISAGDFNIAAVGDWGCTANTHDTIGNIENKDPEIVLALGDFSYSNSPDCWFQEIAPFELKTKIAIGNHDDKESGSSELRTAYMTRFNLNQSFYSYNYENVHILIMDTQLSSNVGSEQYDFAEEDLQAASTDDNTDWILVMFHKPIYSSRAGHVLDESARTNFHPLFDKYGVDLVVQAHNHIYERTHPLKFNNAKPSEPTIEMSNSNHYKDPPNPIFVVVGTGGQGLYDIKQRLPYSAYNTDENYGFLNIEIINSNNSSNYNNSESILNAKFYANSESNNGKIIDEFIITK